MPLTETDPTVDSRPTFTAQYKSLAKRFAVRLCVAVTLCVVVLGAVEFYSYRRYLPAAGDQMEPAVKMDLAQGATPAEQIGRAHV